MTRTAKGLAALSLLAALGAYLYAEFGGDPPESAAPRPATAAAPEATPQPSAPPGASDALPSTAEPARAARAPLPPTATPAQQYAASGNLRKLYDDLAQVDTAEARYFMAKALTTCNLFTGYKLEDHERALALLAPRGSSVYERKLTALQELSRQCEGFYGYQGPSAMQLYKEASAKDHPAATAVTLGDVDRAGAWQAAERMAAALLETGDGETIERLLPYLQLRSKPWTPDLGGGPQPRDVVADAWRLFACSRGADCSATSRHLFEQCWSVGNCGARSFDAYLREFKPQTYDTTRELEAQIARAVANRDWRALGIITGGPRQ